MITEKIFALAAVTALSFFAFPSSEAPPPRSQDSLEGTQKAVVRCEPPPPSPPRSQDSREEAWAKCELYLWEALTDEQHGGIHKAYDFDAGGAVQPNGAIKLDSHLLVWAVDEVAAVRAAESYPETTPKIVVVPAAYSWRELNVIIEELKRSEIADLLSWVEGEVPIWENKVIIDTYGIENRETVTRFLEAYEHRDAVMFSTRLPTDGEMLESGGYFDLALIKYIGFQNFENWLRLNPHRTVYDLIADYNITDETLREILADHIYEGYMQYKP